MSETQQQDKVANTQQDSAAATHAPEGAGGMLSAATGSMGAAVIQRRIARRASGGGVAADAATAVQSAAGDAGAPVDPGIGARVSAATGADVSGARVHTGSASQEAASAVGAQAYTTGNDIHFAAGKYNPGTKEGDHLIAHELVHTVQQRGGSPVQQAKMEVSQPGDTHEHEADRIADQVVSGGDKAGAVASVSSATAVSPVQRKEAAKSDEKKDDNFTVPEGQLTFDAEGNEGGKYHTRTAHWPGGASGVTIGRGYDLGQHEKDTIIEDMTAAGVSKADAEKFAGAAKISGKEAGEWLKNNKASLPEITPEQQKALFETTYEEHLQDVKRISGNYAKTKAKEAGKQDTAEFEVNFDTVHPAIKDILVDLRYRGDYTPATRKYVQPLAIANDLEGLAKVMADKDKWKSVPEDRFERRKNYMAEAVKKQQAGGGQQQQQGGAKDEGKKEQPKGGSEPVAAKGIGTATLKVNVNVRKSPAKNGEILETAKAGTKFTVLANAGSWYKVDYKGGAAYVTTIADYVEYHAAPAPKPPAEKKADAGAATGGATGGGGLMGWLNDAYDAASHLVDNVVAWWEGDADEQRQAEADLGDKKAGGGAKEKVPAEDKKQAEQGGTPAGKEGGSQDKTTAEKEKPKGDKPAGTLLFKDAFEVVDPKAYLRDAAKKSTGKTIAQGTKVFVVAADRTYVQIITAPGTEPAIAEADQVWTAFGNLGGTGADVPLGNEETDQKDKEKADQLRAGLPPGRNPGKSPFKWQFSGYFQPSLEGKSLQGTLMSKVQKLMQWAVENDMVTDNIIIGDGVRGPKTAHKMCVSWQIQYGSAVKLDALKALPGGKDADGTTWYKEGWTWDQVVANANAIRSSNKIAAAGYEYGDKKRAPLPLNSKPGVSRHCTGRAVDVTIPWRAPGKDASKNSTDVWAWEDVYAQFGLHRPLHKNLVDSPNLQENWHIEETGKKLDGNDEVEKNED